MKKACSVIALFLSALTVFSQELSVEFGEIGQAEIDFTSYDKDPEADAVILFDKGKTIFYEFEGGYDIQFTRTKRIKIFKRGGVDEYGEVSIPFYVDGSGRTESIESIEAYTYNYEGEDFVKKELKASAVFEEKAGKNWRRKKFVFPDVKEGSIIEYKYVLQTPFKVKLPDWRFQDRIPTLYSWYSVDIIPFFEYVFLAQGISKFDYQKSEIAKQKRTWGVVDGSLGQDVGNGVRFYDYTHTYMLKDVPAFSDESYITSREDHIKKIDFQLAKFNSPRGGGYEILTTWPKLTSDLLKEEKFGKYLKSSKKIAKKILENEIDLNGKSEALKSKTIIDYVKSNFSWNGYQDKYTSKSVKAFYAQKTGNVADINLFLCSLLTSAGITAKPVILSTREHGKIKTDHPFYHLFDYVVVMVDGEKMFLTDGTESALAYNKIPPRCINDKGLVVQNGEVEWVDLSNKTSSINAKVINIKIDPDKLIADVFVSIQCTEYEAYKYKRPFKDDKVKIRDYYARSFTNVGEVSTFNYGHESRPYVISFDAETEVEKLGSKIIVSPFLNFPIKKNKLTQKKRSYPVDFIYSKTEELKANIEIPAGFKVLSVPEKYKLDNDLMFIDVACSTNNALIVINAKYKLKKPVYQHFEYDRIKFYFDTIVKKFNEHVVLEKM